MFIAAHIWCVRFLCIRFKWAASFDTTMLDEDGALPHADIAGAKISAIAKTTLTNEIHA